MINKLLLVMISAFFMVGATSSAAFAAPSIGTIALTPSNEIWVGESLGISAACSDVLDITDVHAVITGSNGFIVPNQSMSLDSGEYKTTVESLYFASVNDFNANIYCYNNASEVTNKSTSFTVSNFTAVMTNSPSNIFLGEQMEFNIDVEKNGADISGGVTFEITRNGNPVSPVVTPPYDPTKGWVVYLNADTSGSSNYKFVAKFDRTNASASATVSVSDSINFGIESVTQTDIIENDTIELDITALDKGNLIAVTTSNIDFHINGNLAIIDSITQSENIYKIEIITPEEDPGSYSLTATLDYQGETYTDSTTINYLVELDGSFLNLDGNAVDGTIKFIRNGNQKLSLSTSTSGDYKGNIVPDDYDIELEFGQALITVLEADVTKFNDPIKYYHIGKDNIDGMRVAAVHVIEVDLDYDKIEMVLGYDESAVSDEGDLKVYKCSNWNGGERTCNTNWKEIGAFIDTIRNEVDLEQDELSAFAIGTIKSLDLSFILGNQDYAIDSLIKLNGLTIDESRVPVGEVDVTLNILDAGISESVTSDENGVFSIEFVSPSTEGEYTVKLSAEKSPFKMFETESTLNVVKSTKMSIVFPDTVRINQGESKNQILRIINNGQSDLENINVNLEGIPDSYWNAPSSISVSSGEEVSIPIELDVPEDAEVDTKSITLTVKNDIVTRQKIFGFTVEQIIVEDESEVSGGISFTGLFTGIGNAIPSTVVYLGVFAATAFSAAVVMKKRKINESRGTNSDLSRTLMDIKSNMTRNADEVIEIRDIHGGKWKESSSNLPPLEKFIEKQKEPEKKIEKKDDKIGKVYREATSTNAYLENLESKLRDIEMGYFITLKGGEIKLNKSDDDNGKNN